MNLAPEVVDGKVWYSAALVCKMINVKNISATVGRADIPDSEKDTIPLTDRGPKQLVLSRAGMLLVISKGRKPEARAAMVNFVINVLPELERKALINSQQTAIGQSIITSALTEVEPAEQRILPELNKLSSRQRIKKDDFNRLMTEPKRKALRRGPPELIGV